MSLSKALYLALVAIIATFLVASCSGGAGNEMRITSASQTVVVSQAANNGWGIYDDVAESFRGLVASDFVSGPATPPLGDDSLEISVEGTERFNLATYQFSGTPLDEISELGYSTYNASATNFYGPNACGYLQFNVDFNLSDTWQRRLVYLPKDNGPVVPDSWQYWDALAGGSAKWHLSGGLWPGTATPGSTRKTWSEILSLYPDVRIRVTDAFFGIRVGEPYPAGYTENLDNVVFGLNGDTTTFDLELSSKDDCKNGGWAAMGFANQGQCIKAHVAQN